MNNKHITAIVLAAGKGSRMQMDVPKQYLEVLGKPLLYYALKAFEESSVDDIVLVVGSGEIDYCRENIIEKYQLKKVKHIIEGGSERYWSVKNGLLAASGTDYVLIHDGARPCVSVDVIEKSIDEVQKVKACTVGVPVKDTIKCVDDLGYSIDTPPRKYLWQVQTPQSFLYQDIMTAYRKMEEKNEMDITDDTMIIEYYMGMKTKMICGDYCNIKVTTNEDLSVVESFLKKN